nr:MAG: MC010R [Molluscum contagiosum virus]
MAASFFHPCHKGDFLVVFSCCFFLSWSKRCGGKMGLRCLRRE